MRIERFQHGSVLVVVPHGALAEEETTSMMDVLMDPSNSPRLVVSFQDVPYLDSKGIEMLLEVNDHFEAGGMRLRLSDLDESCKEILYLTDHLESFEIHDTVDDAVRNLLT